MEQGNSFIECAAQMFEYSFLPIVVFVFSYFSENNGNQDAYDIGQEYYFKFKRSVYELILVESSVFLSLFLRILTDSYMKDNFEILGYHSTHIYETTAIFVSIILMVYFIRAYIKNQIKRPSISSFNQAYNVFFFSWAFSIIFLGFIHSIFLNISIYPFEALTIFVFICVMYIFFRQAMRKYYITDEIMYIQFTTLLKFGDSIKAQKYGIKFFRKLSKKENSEELFNMLFRLGMALSNSIVNEHRPNKAILIRSIRIMKKIEENNRFPKDAKNFSQLLNDLNSKLTVLKEQKTGFLTKIGLK